MKRRTFIAALGSAAAAWPVVVREQKPTPAVGSLSICVRPTPSYDKRGIRRFHP
jgi:hypothetical protein